MEYKTRKKKTNIPQPSCKAHRQIKHTHTHTNIENHIHKKQKKQKNNTKMLPFQKFLGCSLVWALPGQRFFCFSLPISHDLKLLKDQAS